MKFNLALISKVSYSVAYGGWVDQPHPARAQCTTAPIQSPLKILRGDKSTVSKNLTNTRKKITNVQMFLLWILCYAIFSSDWPVCEYYQCLPI